MSDIRSYQHEEAETASESFLWHPRLAYAVGLHDLRAHHHGPRAGYTAADADPRWHNNIRLGGGETKRIYFISCHNSLEIHVALSCECSMNERIPFEI